VHHLRFVEEFNDDRQIDIQPKQVGRVDGAIRTKARDTAEYDDPLNTLLVLKDRQDLLHERFASPVLGLPEVNAHDHSLVLQLHPLQIACDVCSSERAKESEPH
jgi:hypothetical protein